MIRWLGAHVSRFAGRWVPDPFAIAILLTLGTALLCWVSSDLGLLEVIGLWGGRIQHGELLPKERGVWLLLTFAMQMCLILVTGHALASSPPLKRAIAHLASRPSSSAQAITMTAVVAMLCALLNWGLGLIVGALLAREVASAARRRGLRLHYPILGAAGYTGLLVWHGGLSGSAPLKVTQRKEMARILGDGVDPIPLGETIFSAMNLSIIAGLLIVVPLLLVLMHPDDDDDIQEITDAQTPQVAPAPVSAGPLTPAQRLETSPLLAWGLALMVGAYLVLYLDKLGVDRIGPNGINLAFLSLGLALHGSPRSYGDAVARATQGCSGIILQFPLYAGIMGMMALSGLVTEFAGDVSEAVSPAALAPVTFLSAGAVNLFVPSGGGQWALQGPVVVETAQALKVPVSKVIMAFAHGDAWTNMLQPFWALPLLGITGLKASQLVGYTATLMLLVLPVFLGCFLLF
jgi:short-chain fatty acids transporter